ncbi:hypothetical protein A8990_12342 [Paenibacillus taihuensis]|uniref:Uncharacterized protein n=1 Tax=Paenibacillus taihuensis TaxID=1156355 RepID=A0A3D9RSG3_9BACL|nr:hypothetical protein A8990_12342 [Paenibacillus taihuensis]
MRELVGHCQRCGKAVYCEDGFLNGAIVEGSGALICSDCAYPPKEAEGSESSE